MANEHCKIRQARSCSEFIVRVSAGSGASIQGKIEHIQSGQIQYFHDFLEMILLMQKKMDEYDYPQAETELRTIAVQNNSSGRFS